MHPSRATRATAQARNAETLATPIRMVPGTYQRLVVCSGPYPIAYRCWMGPVIGNGCTIAHNSLIEENVILGEDVTIEGFCHIGYPTKLAEGENLVIGDRSLIRSHSVIYQGSTLGRGTETGHHVTIREHTTAGDGWRVGTLSDIQGETTIGQHVRMHSNVHVGQRSVIGDFVWIFPYVVLTNDPHPPSDGYMTGVTIDDYAVIATMSCLLPGVRIGARAVVGASSLVSKDVPAGALVAGVPARDLGSATRIKLRDGSGDSAYPWMRHFHRGYPQEVVDRWDSEFGTSDTGSAGD